MRRRAAATRSLAIAVALAAAWPGQASAVEFFASPDETRTTQSCLTPAAACALGVAVKKAPASPTGAHELTLAAGTYDLADIDAGAAPGAEPGQLVLPQGLNLRGENAVAGVVIRSGSGSSLPTVSAPAGATIRLLRIERTGSAAAVAVRGTGTQTPDLPVILDRAIVTADGAGAAALAGVSVVRNSLLLFTGAPAAPALAIDASGAAGSAVASPVPRLLGITVRSTGTALRVSASGADLQSATITNAILGGAVGASATAPTGVPGPLTVTATRVAWPAQTPAVDGPASFVTPVPPVAFTDAMLDAGQLPLAGSPLVDAGADFAGIGTNDLAANRRTVGSAPDLGAYERQDTVASPSPAPAANDPLPPLPADDWGTGGAWDDLGPDRTEPWLTLVSSVRKLSAKGLTKGLTIKLTTDEAATAKVELVVKVKRKGRKTTERVVGSATSVAAAAGDVAVKLKIRKGKVPSTGTRATLRVSLTDLAGNVSRVSEATKIVA